MNTGNNLLFLVVSGLLAFMSVTGLAGMYNIQKLIPDLHPPGELFAGIPAPFTLTLTNSKRYLHSFLIKVEIGGFHSRVYPVIARGSSTVDSIPLVFPVRGETGLPVITISSTFPVGFFTRYWSFCLSDTVVVFPAPIAAGSFGNGEDTASNGAEFRRERGLNGELERISPYTGSEPLRMIHWKHSARSNELMVKDFGRSSASPLLIALDTLPGNDVEVRLSRAAWLVRHWVGTRPVGIQFSGRIINPGIGRQHGITLLTELARYDSN